MKILLAVETLHPGGAEMFALRLAAAMSLKHEVVLFRFYKEAADQAWVDKYPVAFTHAWPEIPFDKFWRRADRMLRLLKIDFSFRERQVKRSLDNLIASFRPDVIHSNQIKVDYVMAQVKTDQALVITLHGDYKTFDELKDRPRRILNFDRKLKFIESKKPAFVYLSDAQKSYLALKGIGSSRSVKIYNGYFALAPSSQKDDSVFTFGMIARGIPEKGWQIAIDAFLIVHQQFPNTQLLLIGDSPYLQKMKTLNEKETSIKFAGQSSEPLHWVSQMHVGLLPSYYSSESLPTSVIEYLLCGVPVLASDAGEIETMISTTEGPAGKTIHLEMNNSDAEKLSALMKRYLKNSDLYNEHSRLALQAFKKFEMQTCVEAYENLYQTELNRV